MEAAIKETVKNIFKGNKFEDALELTSELRGEYIRECGVKSWNALVTYYKSVNIIPEPAVAEPEADDPDDGAEIPDADEIEADDTDVESVETVEYMLYRNTGDKVEWFGHRENFNGLQVGDTARMIRMNNKGVSEGQVIASNKLTLDDVALFHRCYGVIIKMKRSNKEQLDLAAKCLMNIPAAINRQYYRVSANDHKLTDYVLNFNK